MNVFVISTIRDVFFANVAKTRARSVRRGILLVVVIVVVGRRRGLLLLLLRLLLSIIRCHQSRVGVGQQLRRFLPGQQSLLTGF